MEYSSLVSVWWTDTVLFPQGGLFGIEGPAVRFEVCIHNANPVPVFDVELLAREPTSPPDSPKEQHGEWHALGPGATVETPVEIGIWSVDDRTYEGDPDLEIRFTDIDGRKWSRGESGRPTEIDDQ